MSAKRRLPFIVREHRVAREQQHEWEEQRLGVGQNPEHANLTVRQMVIQNQKLVAEGRTRRGEQRTSLRVPNYFQSQA